MSKKKHIFRGKSKTPVQIIDKCFSDDSSLITGEQVPTHIVIHEVSLGTGRSPKEYNLDYYEQRLKKFSEDKRTIGYHYLVSDNEIYHFIPDDKSTDHTGTIFGNHNSIGIERLICDGIDFEKAVHNQAQLIATLMLKYNIPIQNIYTHKQMQMEFGGEKVKKEPKACPGRLNAGFRGTVSDFKNEITRCFLYGWFFTELLDEDKKSEIPKLMKITKSKIEEENKKAREKRRYNFRKIKKSL